ncbi:MAG: cytochrome-c peroxidase [Calothrix sp. MO_167.B12]|nr:cytochrome-c peroxidase [Calothrix sp. MO_167.B12]
MTRFLSLQNFIYKYRQRYILGLFFCLAALIAVSITTLQEQSVNSPVKSESNLVAFAAEPIQPIPLKVELDSRKVELGKKLFHEPRLSSNNSMSCATCHILEKGGTERLPTSKGMNGHQLSLNSPTVFNSGFNSRQLWDGSVETLEDQIDGPILKVGEMGGASWSDIVRKLKQDSEYAATFKRIYADGMNRNNIKDAIATFERSLYTPNAPFDKYLRGDEDAISKEAKEGYNLFKSYGCVTCHQGMLVGGNMFQKFGIFGNYFADRGNVVKSDLGRYNVTKNEQDRHVFKVPSLRNIMLTAPYLHDGNAKTLDEAIKLMAKYQLGVEIPQKDVDLIMKFLITLTGEYEGKPL